MSNFGQLRSKLDEFLKNHQPTLSQSKQVKSLREYINSQEAYYMSIPANIRTANTLRIIVDRITQRISQLDHHNDINNVDIEASYLREKHYREELEDQVITMGYLTKSTDATKQNQDELKAKDAELKAKELELTAKELELMAKETALTDAQRNNKACNEIVDANTTTIDDLNQKVETARQNAEQISNGVHALDEQNKSLTKQLENKQTELIPSEGTDIKLSSEYSALLGQLNACDGKYKTLTNNTDNQLFINQEHINDLTKQLDDLTKQTAIANIQPVDLSKIAELEKKNDELTTQLKQCGENKIKLNNANDKINTATRTIRSTPTLKKPTLKKPVELKDRKEIVDRIAYNASPYVAADEAAIRKLANELYRIAGIQLYFLKAVSPKDNLTNQEKLRQLKNLRGDQQNYDNIIQWLRIYPKDKNLPIRSYIIKYRKALDAEIKRLEDIKISSNSLNVTGKGPESECSIM